MHALDGKRKVVDRILGVAGKVLDRSADAAGFRGEPDRFGGLLGIMRPAVLQIRVDGQVRGRGDDPAVFDDRVEPSMFITPRLVVASASNPIAASSFAVPASQGLGMMKAPGRSCRALNAFAFSIWLRMAAPVRERRCYTEPNGLSSIRQICYFFPYHQFFA
jgi:hypothetical protein